MCLARCGVGGDECECIRGLGLGFTNPVGTEGVLGVCLCLGGVGGVDGVCREWVGSLYQGHQRSGWCYVCVSCESGFFM